MMAGLILNGTLMISAMTLLSLGCLKRLHLLVCMEFSFFYFFNIICLDNIRPSCLPKAGQTADPGMVVTPIGWGRPSDCKQ